MCWVTDHGTRNATGGYIRLYNAEPERLQQRRLAGRGRRRWRTSTTFTPLATRDGGAAGAPPVSSATLAGAVARPDLRAFCDLPLRLHPRDRYVPLRVVGDRGRTRAPRELFLVRDGAGAVVGRTSLHRDAASRRQARPPHQLFGLHRVRRRRRGRSPRWSTRSRHGPRRGGRCSARSALLPNQTGGVITSGFAERGFVDSAWNPAVLPGRLRAARLRPPLRGATRGSCDVRAARRRTRGFRFDDARLGRRAARASGTAPDGTCAASCRSCGRCSTRASRSSATTPRSPPSSSQRRPTAWPTCSTSAAAVAGEGRTAGRVRRHRAGHLGVPHGRRRPARRASTSCACWRPGAGTGATRCSSSRARCPDEQGNGYLTLLSRELHRNLRAGGYRTLRSTFVERGNPASAAQYRRAGGRPLHGHTFYERSA